MKTKEIIHNMDLRISHLENELKNTKKRIVLNEDITNGNKENLRLRDVIRDKNREIKRLKSNQDGISNRYGYIDASEYIKRESHSAYDNIGYMTKFPFGEHKSFKLDSFECLCNLCSKCKK